MVRLSSSLTSLLILLGLLLPQISATLGSMPLPDDVTPGVQAVDHQAQSPAEPQPVAAAEPQAEPGSAEQTDHHSEAQFEPRQGLTSAKCLVYPVNRYYRVVVDFWNWDPDKRVKAAVFEKTLGVKLGKENFHGFWWRKYPPRKEKADTKFMFNVPYEAEGRIGGNMYEVISDAIYEYTGDAKVRIPCYMF